MSDERQLYAIGVVKIPHANRDVARRVFGETGEERDFLNILGGDTPDDDTTWPVGSECTYAARLTESEAQEFAAASNCRYVLPDTALTACSPDNVPKQITRTFMGQGFPNINYWHGTDVPVAVIDTGTSPQSRSYMSHQLLGRFVGNTSDPPPVNGIYPGVFHGCACASVAIPAGGKLFDAVICDRNGIFSSVYGAAAVRWAAESGAKVMSCSWGYSGDVSSNPWIIDAVNYALGFDVVMVFAAGNDSVSGLFHPASMAPTNLKVHAVMAWDQATNTLSTFSNYSTHPAVGVAPGQQITAVVGDGTEVDTFYGTSAAAPNAANCVVRLRTGGTYNANTVSTAMKGNYRNTGRPVQGGGAYDMSKAVVALGGNLGITPESPIVNPLRLGAAAVMSW